ncbi:uncharacterized protein LOC144732097 isoform X1 [Lampetra planeri]
MSRYPCPLKCGYKLDVLLSHAEPQSPDNPLLLRFWARLTRADIDANFYTIRKAVMMPPSWEPVGLSTPLAVGESCIAWYSKEATWHRAKVLAHAESQQSQQGIVHNYLVFFIDLGLREVVQAGFMREGRPEFFQIPPMMQCYALANVLPMSNCWSKMVLDYVESQRDTKMHGCVEGFLDDHTIVINLELMVMQLCQMRCARPVDSDVFQLIVKLKIMDDAKPETAQLPKLPTVSPAILGNLKHHFNAEPPPIIPPAGPKTRSAEGRHEMSAFYSARMPVGTLQAVLVTHVISPDSFFCQLQSFRLDLQRLIQLMALRYLEADARGVQYPLPPNSPCAVLNTRIGQWYRGLVIHNSSPSEALVHFVDFGTRACMPSKHLQPLLSEFFDLPVQAFRCAMVGAHATLQEGSRIWSTEEVLLLKSILLNSVFTAQVVSYNRIEKLYYVVLLDQNGQSAFQKFSEMAATRPAMEATLPDRVATVATLPDTAATAIGHGSGVPPSVMAPPPMALAGVGAGRPVFTALKLHLQNFTHVYAENIVSPDEFWVRLTSKNEEFEKLMVQMQKHFSLAGPHEGLLDKTAVGMACCAMCPNNMFYRATVTDVISARKVQVQCVDYGISQFVEPKDIRALPPHFLELPACVVRCRLAGVAPPEVRHQGGDRTSTDRWSRMATWFFNSQVFNKHVAMIPRSKSADGYEVDLYSIGKSESSSIAKELIRGGLAVALSSHAELLKVNSAGVSDSMVAASSPAGPSSDGANDHDSVVPQPQEVAPVPRPAVGGSITVVEPLMFVVGEMTNVIVTSIKSPWEFWCRLTSAERDVALLNRKMNEHYRNWKAPLPHLEAGVCVAHYAPEDQWYRVCIYEVLKGSRSMASVLILDDGREVQVSTRDLYPIDPQFLKLKMQAFKCSLYNCLEAHEEQRDQATEMFKSFTKEALACGLNCTIIMLVERNKRDFFNLVDLHTPFQSVSAQLISKGLAKLLDPPGHLAESDCPLSFPYTTHGIKIGAEEGVIMTHAEGPSRFWCQLTRNVDALKLFMVKLGKHCSHAYSRQTFDMKRRLCFAQYAGDGQWHRALATQGPNPNEVNVSFIDYGNNEVVEKSKLLPLLPDAYYLAELPCQAIQCFLVDVSAPKEGFPHSVLSFFRDMVYSSEMKAVVLCREDFGQLGLELFHGSQRLNTTINQMLNPSLPPSRGLHQLPEVIAQTGSARRDAVTYRAREQSHRPPVTSAPSHEPPERLVPVLGPAPAQGRHKPTKPADREPEQSAVYLRKGNGKHAESPSSKREQPEALPRRVFGSDSLRMDQVVRERSPDAMNTAGYRKAMHEEPSYSFWRQIGESENSSRQWRDKATTRDRNGRSVHSEGSSQADGTCSLTRENVTPHNAAAHNVTPDNVTPKYLESSVTSVLGDTTLEERTQSCSPICHSTVIDEEGYATREKEQEAKAKIIPKLEDLAASPVGDGQAGATLNVFVLHVVTPSRFYVQLASDEQTIYGLAEELNDGSVSGGSLRPSDLKLGDLICAKYSDDESWYRAVVRGFEPDDPLALVEFIDYGNTDRVGSDSMSELRTEFLRHPRRSIACSLAGVRPCVSVHSNKWTKEAAELFTETVHDLELRCKFLARAHGGDDALWEVNLTAESGTSIADALVAKGMADTLTIATSGESMQERQEQQQEQRQERNQQASETTAEPDRATTNSTHEDNHGVEMDGKLELGQQYEVYVSLARGLDNFWCQLKVLADEQLTSLMSVIETTGDEREVSLAMVEVGGLYLARYSEDNVLYRARVLDVAAGRAKVMFIDYGNEEELDVSCLRGVPPNVAVAPPFAFPCFLRGSTGCIVADEVTDAFVGACLEESRMLKVVAVVTTVADCCTHSAFYEVELYDEHGDPFSEKYLRGTFAQDPLQRQEQGPVVDLNHAESGQGETKEAPPKDEVSDKEKVLLFKKARLKSSAEEVHADVEPHDGGNPEPVISTIKDYPAAPPLAAGETLSVHCLSYNLELGEVSSPAAGTGEELLGDEEVIPPLRLEELVPGTPCMFRSRVEAVVLEGEYDATVAVVRHEDSDAEEEVHVPLVLRLGKDPIALPPHDSCCRSFGLAGTSEGCQGGGKGHCQGTDVQWVAATAACEDGGSGQWIGGGEPVVETGGRPPAAVEPGRVAKGMADTLTIGTSGESTQERQEQQQEQQQERKQQASETTAEPDRATTNSTHEDNHGVEMDGKLELGQQYEVYVSLARGLDNFWCQLKVLADEQLTSLMSVIETTGDEREVSLAMVEVGGLYLARYSEDNVLYRARVLDVAAGRAKVMFIDYGNEEELDVSCLRGVPPNVAVAPPFAFPCFLRGSTGCIVADEVTDAFVGACLEESRMLKVVAVVTTVADCCTHSAFYEVELYDEHGDPFSEKYLRGAFAQDPLQRQEQGPVVDLDHAESGQGETKEAPPKDEVSDKEKVPLFEKARLKSSAEEVHTDVEPRDGGNPEPVISTIKDYPAAPPLAADETLNVHCLSYNLELGEFTSPAAGTGEELLGDEEEVIPPLGLEELVPGTPCTFRSRVEAVVLEGEYDATVAVVTHEDSDAEEEVHVPLVLRLGKDPIALPPHDSCCCSFGLAGTSEGCQGGGKGHCHGADVQWVAAVAACEDGGSGQWIGGGEPVVETGGRPPAAVEPGRVDPPLDQLAQETQDPSHETEELDDCAVVADEEVVGGEECEYEEAEMTAASDDNNQNSAWTGGEGGEPHLLVPCKGREEELPRHLVLASVGEQDCATADGTSVDIAGHAEASMLPHDSAVALLPASGSLALGDSERRMGRDVALRGFGKFAGTFARDLADNRVESVTLTAQLRCLSGAAPALPLRASPCRSLEFRRERVGAAYDPRSPANTVARGGLNADVVHGKCTLRLRLVNMDDGRGVTFLENTVPLSVNLLGSKQRCLALPPSSFPNKPLDENVKVISLSGAECHRKEADNSWTVEKNKAEEEKTTLPWNDPDTLRFEDMSDADLSDFDEEHWIQRPGTVGSGAAAQFVLVAQTDRAAAPVEEEVRERPSKNSSPPPTPPDNNEFQAEHEALHEVLRRSEGAPWPDMEKGDCLYEDLESCEYFERRLLASNCSLLSSDYLMESYLDIGVLSLEDSDVEQWHESSEFLAGLPDDSGDDNELYFPAEVDSSVLSPLDSGFTEEVAPTGRREGRLWKTAEPNLPRDPSGDVANGETAGATSLHTTIAAAATAAGVEIAAEVSDGQGAAGVSEEGEARLSLLGDEAEIVAALVPESVAFTEEGEEEVGTIIPTGSLCLQSVLAAPLACGAVGDGTEEVSPPRCHGDVVTMMGMPTIVVHSDSDDEEEPSRPPNRPRPTHL